MFSLTINFLCKNILNQVLNLDSNIYIVFVLLNHLISTHYQLRIT